MSDQQEVQRQIALMLRDMASRFLGSAAGIDVPELRRKLTQWAFELVREAVALEPIEDQAEPGSLSPSGAPNPAAHAALPVPRRRNSRPMATRVTGNLPPVRLEIRSPESVIQTSVQALSRRVATPRSLMARTAGLLPRDPRLDTA
jgi:hypothetical protein